MRIAWDKTAKTIESDSLSSSSSTSSLDEIPHYILDSATSPETQTGDKFIPRVEVRDSAGELMQIDSLMIVDGKYVGDPDDLKLLEKLPEGTVIVDEASNSKSSNSKANTSDTVTTPDVIEPLISPTISQQSTTTSTTAPVIKEDKISTKAKSVATAAAAADGKVENNKSIEDKKCDTNNKNNLDSILKYDNNKPDLKFDTKNENKLDTLRNLPLIISKKEKPPSQLTFAESTTTINNGDKREHQFNISDTDKTPTVANPPKTIPSQLDDVSKNSDSETEITGQALTETELSDWTADDAVSENFVDIEFVLNSNKGTIKRNKKCKTKKRAPLATNNAAIKTGDYIAGSLNYDNIEFMDTGSEDSCVETYSTINKAMLRNRGYVEFVDHHDDVKDYMQYKPDPGFISSPAPPSTLQSYNRTPIVEAINKELPKIDFIEQGACILNNDFDLKTPINEVPPMLGGGGIKNHVDHANDMEEDSLLMIASQTTTTTEDSDALTVVTSPLDSYPEKYENFSSDSTKTEEKKIEIEKLLEKTINNNIADRKEVNKTPEDMSYEEYVRQLQTKIREISTARDSLDMRKSRRKSSKGDEISASSQILSNSATPTKNLSIFQDSTQPTVTKKLEEITKERTKQKDLIHDLVMDKLQTKKQLNAEKRLNRSRNRNVIFSSTQVSHNPHGADSCEMIHPIAPERRNSKSKESTERRFSFNATVSPIENKESIRPLSAHISSTPKILKTQSFCVNTTTNSRSPFSEFRTPIAQPRTKTDQSTDKAREDARQRARLKSNEDLGLSPEEKIKLLRKRYQLDMQHVPDPLKNKSDDMKFRERRLMSSKSVNDITTVHQLATELRKSYIETPQSTPQTPKHTSNNFDFSSSEYDLKKAHSQKDRKGLIQTVSDFFHKKKDSKESSKESSPTKDKEITAPDKTRFGLFRLSPRSKSKVCVLKLLFFNLNWYFITKCLFLLLIFF